MHSKSNIEKTIFWGSCFALLLVAVPIFVVPDSSNTALNALNQNIENNFSYLYTWMAILVISVSLWIILSKVGRIKLGKTRPEFRLFSWTSMLFCAGVATGILYWGTIEWAYYINTPPFGLNPGSNEAYEWAATYGMFHWGIAGWAFYVIPALAVGHAFIILGLKKCGLAQPVKEFLANMPMDLLEKPLIYFL